MSARYTCHLTVVISEKSVHFNFITMERAYGKILKIFRADFDKSLHGIQFYVIWSEQT